MNWPVNLEQVYLFKVYKVSNTYLRNKLWIFSQHNRQKFRAVLGANALTQATKKTMGKQIQTFDVKPNLRGHYKYKSWTISSSSQKESNQKFNNVMKKIKTKPSNTLSV